MDASKFSFLLFILALSAASVLSRDEDDKPRVQTPVGGIRGYYKLSANGRSFEAYEGIPYALPPVGKLRFKPPQKMPAWTGELPAMRYGNICLQYKETGVHQLLESKVVGAEDCLYLNIYTPRRDSDSRSNGKLLPVIFWIHGGAFQYGSGMYMGPKYLMDRDIVYVTVNYRLGPLGFLSTEDEVLPGNNGLKDQSMALKWVSDNIRSFGGDPDKITLVGLSAGGASVHYHYLSPWSAGLFQGGISISGTAFNCWTQTENSLEKTKKLAALMGCPTTSSRDMVQCLRYRPSGAIVQATEQFQPWLYNPFSPFGPVVERQGDAPFINRSPVEIVASGDVQDVPWVTGVTSEEGLYNVADFISSERHIKELDDNWVTIAPYLLDFNYTIPKEKHAKVANLIKKEYLGSKPISKATLKKLIHMTGDRLFVVDSEKAAKMQAKVNQKPVWYYYYTYRAAQSLSDSMSGTKENYGVSHGDDAYLVVENPFIDPTIRQEDIDMQQVLIDFWFSFATDRVPKVGNVEWKEMDPSESKLRYLHIAAPGKYSIESDDNFGNKNFWSSIRFAENILKETKRSKQELR